MMYITYDVQKPIRFYYYSSVYKKKSQWADGADRISVYSDDDKRQ